MLLWTLNQAGKHFHIDKNTVLYSVITAYDNILGIRLIVDGHLEVHRGKTCVPKYVLLVFLALKFFLLQAMFAPFKHGPVGSVFKILFAVISCFCIALTDSYNGGQIRFPIAALQPRFQVSYRQ